MAHPQATERQPRRVAEFAQAASLHREGRIDQAIDLYARIVARAPDHVGCWMNLGAALRQQRAFPASVACYRRALELAPNDPAILSNLGNALKDLGRLDESIDAHKDAVGLEPDNARFVHNLGIALKQAGRLGQAREAFARCCELAPDNPQMSFDHAITLLHLGSFAEGWASYEARWHLGELPASPHNVPFWRGEPFPDKTLLVTPEQGFGDSILASRFLPQVKARGGRVILHSKPETGRLFDGLPGIDLLEPLRTAPDDIDLQCPIMSLPGIFETNLDNLPPPSRLNIPQAARDRIEPLLATGAGRFKIGIVWSGSLTFKGNHERRAPLDAFLRFAEVPGVQLFSLQKGPAAAELQQAGAGPLVIDLAPHLDDFADTAAVVEQLDLVVMTDSAVAHLAGSLGRPVWNLLSLVPYWLYLNDRLDTPWYPSMRLFRQSTHGDWDSVFQNVRTALEALVSARISEQSA